MVLLYPNSGSLFEALNFFHKKICGLSDNKWKFCDLDVLISIVVDIAHRNPRTYPNCAAILSKLINRENDALEKQKTFEKIHNRFKELPNTNYMEIWLQRISLKISNYETSNFNEKLCRIICSSSENDDKIWEDDWISSCVLKKSARSMQIN